MCYEIGYTMHSTQFIYELNTFKIYSKHVFVYDILIKGRERVRALEWERIEHLSPFPFSCFHIFISRNWCGEHFYSALNGVSLCCRFQPTSAKCAHCNEWTNEYHVPLPKRTSKNNSTNHRTHRTLSSSSLCCSNGCFKNKPPQKM